MDVIRGSEWRRWEMHLHTPFTKKEDQYVGNTIEEKWNNFYTTIDNYVGDGTDPLKAICTIAITDYLSIDNYKAVRTHNRLPSCVQLILPNVELRMQPIAQNSPINIHCIFSPEIVDEIDERFFGKLSFEYNCNSYSATKAQLVSLGRAYSGNVTLDEEEACRVASLQYVISFDTLAKVFKNDLELRKNTIIVVSNKSSDGASGTRTHSDYFVGNVSQLDATRRSIYQLSDMIFSSNQSDLDYFLGKGADNMETVMHKCGALMPCIHGCDAHTNIKIFEPSEKRYCWIKTDPTFEGLKQVLYEPKERVRISSTYPELKQNYYVIDYVEITNNTDFSTTPIYFNDKLTCIIGGKSTGKSLLLHNIASAIDTLQVKKKSLTAVTNVKALPQLKVYWRDGVCSDEKDKERKIVYIPQTYLNRLSDEKEEIGDTQSITAEINKLSLGLEQLSKEYNVTEDEVKLYQQALEEIQRILNLNKTLVNEKESISLIESVLQKKDLSQKGISFYNDKLTEIIDKILSEAHVEWKLKRTELIQEIDNTLKEKEITISELQLTINLLKPKMEGNEQIGKISSSILEEKSKLEKISKLDSDLSENNKIYEAQIAMLAEAFQNYKNYYLKYANSVNERFITPTDDLDFKVECVFRKEQFSEKVLELFNNKTLGRLHGLDLSRIAESDLLDANKIRLLLETIVANSTETVQLKTGHTPESALRDIFSDWYNVDYLVTMDGDSIEEMSPGKKALVLLRLLISLAESKCPILIDQPEDDLDNRSIFDELIQFIKTKKVDRQRF